MIALLTTGHVFDVVLGVIALELLLLGLYRWLRGEHLVAVDVYPNLISAAALLAAARVVLERGSWGVTGGLLVVALLAHLAALRLGWRGSRVSRLTGWRYHGALQRIHVSRR